MDATNPIVAYVASLRTQNQGANPSYVQETRGVFLAKLRDEAHGNFPEESDLHVASGIDGLVDAIAKGTAPWRLVVLTGDAGDGKTQACARLAASWQIELDPVTEHGEWVIVKDASELPRDQLAGIFERWHQAASSQVPLRLLIAINEGRLRSACSLLGEAWDAVVAPSLDGLLDDEAAERLEQSSLRLGVLVLNFRHRLFVRAGVRGLLYSWTAARYWEQGVCANCTSRERCPILANARDLRNVDRVEELADVLMWLHLAGQRLPFRRLQGILAFAFTGGLNCSDVRSADVTSSSLVRHRYYAGIFITTGREPGLARQVQPEPAAVLLAALDLSRVADRAQDEVLLAEWRNAPPLEGPEGAVAREGVSPEELLATLRQRAQVVGRSAAVPWSRALQLLEDAGRVEDLRALVVRAINRIDGHLDNSTALQPILSDPEGIVTFDRRAVDLLLPAPVVLRARRSPAVPSMVKQCLDEVATVVELVAAAAPGQAAPALAVDVLLLERFIGVLERGASVVSLGGYRNDLLRFLSRVVTTAAGGDVAVVLRLGDHRLRLGVTDKKLRLESV